MTRPPCQHAAPLPDSCDWCAMAVRKDRRYAQLWWGLPLDPGATPARPPKPRLPKGVPHCPGCLEKRKSDQMSGQKNGGKMAAEVSSSMTAKQMAEAIQSRPPGGWPEGWAGWDCTRDAHLLLMRGRMADAPAELPGKGGGRGIVVSVNAKPGMSSGKHLPHGYLPGAWVLVKELRRLGCTLPVTFAYLGELEWDPTLTRLMEPLGVRMLDLRKEEEADPRRPRILAGWESKCYSVIRAPYEQVLYLDADQVPMRDPTFLFDSAQFRHFGAAFWPDVPPFDREEWLPACVWANVGLEYRDEVDFESGQFIVDKGRCVKELDLAMWMNAHSDYFYRFIFGDKSTFHLAWAVCGTNYAMPQRGAGGNPASLFQHDFAGNVLFQHLTRNKPSLGGFPSPGSLLKRAECEAHLEELRGKWHGKLWYNADPSPREEAWRKELEGRAFVYERVGLESRPMRLLEDGRIGRGLAKLEVNWSVWDEGGSPLLMITGLDDCPTAALRKDDRGVWAGRWLQYERCPVRLVPEGAPRLAEVA